MLKLGDQMDIIIRKRFSKVVKEAGEPFVIDIFDRMVQNTRSGIGFPNTRYDSNYEVSTIKRRKKKGYQTDYTDLRFSKSPRITQRTTPLTNTKFSEVGFVSNPNKYGQSAGEIFYYHHVGIKYNGKTKQRQIFPDKWSSVPVDIKEELYKRIGRVMNGK